MKIRENSPGDKAAIPVLRARAPLGRGDDEIDTTTKHLLVRLRAVYRKQRTAIARGDTVAAHIPNRDAKHIEHKLTVGRGVILFLARRHLTNSKRPSGLPVGEDRG